MLNQAPTNSHLNMKVVRETRLRSVRCHSCPQWARRPYPILVLTQREDEIVSSARKQKQQQLWASRLGSGRQRKPRDTERLSPTPCRHLLLQRICYFSNIRRSKTKQNPLHLIFSLQFNEKDTCWQPVSTLRSHIHLLFVKHWVECSSV